MLMHMRLKRGVSHRMSRFAYCPVTPVPTSAFAAKLLGRAPWMRLYEPYLQQQEDVVSCYHAHQRSFSTKFKMLTAYC